MRSPGVDGSFLADPYTFCSDQTAGFTVVFDDRRRSCGFKIQAYDNEMFY